MISKSIAGAPARTPILQITKVGTNVSTSDDEFAALRRQYQEQHWLRLPNFADSSLLELVERKLSQSEYCVVDRETGVELRPVDCTAYLATELLLNSPQLLRAIEQITGCQHLVCFSGRIYRRPPKSDFYNNWHTDVTDEGRLIALSLNLTPEQYEGGALEIRSAATKELICEVHNSGYGDAVIFPVDERFEHRVCPVEGTIAKTALAGWFRSIFDPGSLFGRERKRPSK